MTTDRFPCHEQNGQKSSGDAVLVGLFPNRLVCNAITVPPGGDSTAKVNRTERYSHHQRVCERVPVFQQEQMNTVYTSALALQLLMLSHIFSANTLCTAL